MKRLFAFVLAFFFAAALLPSFSSAHADDVGVSTWAELRDAVSAAGEDAQILLQGGFIMEDGITLPEGAKVTIRAQSPGIVLSGEGFAGAMFTVPHGSFLILKGKEDADLTLRGTGVSVAETESPDGGIVSYGTLEAENVLFEGFSAEQGAAVCLPDGDGTSGSPDAVLRFCTFSGNSARTGGALYVGSGRSAQVTASVFRDNSDERESASAYVGGLLIFGDNNQISGPQDYTADGDGFRFGQEISGTGSFQSSRRTDVGGVVNWGGKGEVPLSVEVVLLADGEEAARRTVTPGADEVWSFRFRDLPADRDGERITYDLAEVPVDGYRYKKSGEADVGFEILYAEITEQDAPATDPAEPSADPNEPVFEGTSIMPPVPEGEQTGANAPVVTKSPTDETAKPGSKVIFIARADNASSVVWHLISPDDSVDYTGEEALEYFTDLEIEGLHEEKLKIENLPASLGGWKVRAEFTGEGGSVFSDAAVIHVGAEQDPPAPSAEPSSSPAAEPSPDLTEELKANGPVTLVKSPTGEAVDLNGKAIFIAQAENPTRIVWHLISPDGTMDLVSDQILSAFPALDVEGLGTEKLKLNNIPLSLHGWKALAEFQGEGGPIYSEEAPITINHYDTLVEEARQKAVEAGQDPSVVTEIASPPPAAAAAAPEPVAVPAVEVTPVPVSIPEITSAPATSLQTPEIKSLQVTAVWNDNNNAAGLRPVNTIVELYRNDALYLTTALNSAGDWSYTFPNLASGNYQVKEVAPEQYQVSYSVNGNSVMIVNTYSAPAAPTPASYGTASVYTPSPVSTPLPTYSTPAAASSTPVPTSAPAPAAVSSSPAPTQRPAATPSPAPAAQAGNDDPLAGSGQGINIGLWVGALGVIGLMLAAVAFYLIRKPRKPR